ncbi:sigma-54-dependent transcriptional regulator [Propionispora hippei]|uniref:Transcriptional regulator containing an AAA-type ATPase domain and a DNA-binding domain n=1 Tax=Propionispora hippei DSM 15287 TaxID=1123003 RepID=A0A1M6I0T9_9FIRM|nr:sigma 54-interacting transcriptional regulator [Propionispora hippei]SHJ28037.1 Transcriptional regulator containing an AAA-type ATPase domain and a DNA-binding domain [Propionispora hippei DSM 15287]
MQDEALLTRKDRIYQVLNKTFNKQELQEPTQILEYGLHAGELSAQLNIDRSNVSRELNQLVKSTAVIKVAGKPVLYFSKNVLERLFPIQFSQYIFSNRINFLQFLHSHGDKKVLSDPIQKAPLSPAFSTINESKTESAKKIFDNIIGADCSLKNQVKQAIAAIVYPPSGLHTFLIGPTGVGKTTFAELMYRYSMEIGKLKPNAPYIIFNCADYAGNSQLLLSYLFGHIKGAFTGADKTKLGLIDAADGGILFLDEVHRLPPEGQEMLFSLMDRGKFRRLGESNNQNEANILFILATTENPEKSVLTTFLRRIPCIIKIPSLAERPMKERMQLICAFFTEESKKIKLPVTVSTEVLRFFLLYDCKGSIGQLKNDIQIICANAFVDYLAENKSKIYIKLSQLANRFAESMFTIDQKREELVQSFDLNSVVDLTFNAETTADENPLKKILLHDDYRTEEYFYESLLNSSRKYFEEGKSIADIKRNINSQVENYFNKHPHTKTVNTPSESESMLYRIIQKQLVNVVKEILAEVAEDWRISIDSKIVYSLALHIEALTERIRTGVHEYRSNLPIDHTHLTDEYEMSLKIKEKLEKALFIKIPNEEAVFIAMFLHALKNNDTQDYISVIVITHGDSTASSMSSVANQLLSTDHVKAIDMPLTETTTDTLTKAIDMVRESRPKGVLFLVDMGSLTTFSESVTKQTGIPSTTIKMVSTPMVIEAARKAMMPNMTLELLAEEVKKSSIFIGQSMSIASTIETEGEYISTTESNELDCFDYDHDKMLRLLEQVLIFLNPTKAYKLLNDVYISLIKKLAITPDRGLKIKFMFHNMGMIERIISKEKFEYIKLKDLKKEKKSIFYTLKAEYKVIENAFGIEIPESEFAYIVEMLNIYIE